MLMYARDSFDDTFASQNEYSTHFVDVYSGWFRSVGESSGE